MKTWLIGGVAVVLAFAAGGACMWAYQARQDPMQITEQNTGKFLDDMFDDEFFNSSRDPFSEIERMHKHMDQMFRNDRFSSGFDHWFDQRFGKFGDHTLKMKEDRDSIEYQIDVNEKDLVDLRVNVENGYVAIEARMKTQDEHQVSESQLSQRFPLPAGADPDSVRIEKQSDKVVIHFDKSNA